MSVFLAKLISDKIFEYRITPEKKLSQSGTHQYTTTHQQEVWISALEFCESRGLGEAENPKDKDGTASLWWFQFKPDTFERYGLRYELIKPATSTESLLAVEMKSYELTREIVRRMIGDPMVKWDREFPDCILRKVGFPPKK